MTALPRGRHGLSRQEVVAAQRERMFRGMAAAMAERGYVGTSVAEIIKRAGVSRETFYEQFGSKQDCFIAALEEAISRLQATLTSHLPNDATPMSRFSQLLAAYLETLAAEPEMSRLFMVEVYAAGPDVMRRRLELQDTFVEALAAIFEARSRKARFACESLVATTVTLVTARIVLGEPGQLVALRKPLVELAGTLFPDA